MIDAEILPITSELLKSEEFEVREQAALLIGSFALSAIGRQLFDYAFPNLRDLLEDEELDVRKAAAWAFRQLTVNDDGCQRIVESGCPEAMINSFIKHSSEEEIAKEDA
jgi:3-methyladenine DNA glycosylase AlkD